ncbi:hypothetical protein LCGC14_1964040 [marine sediment metagenome]|uniref:Uncharacterized protein n=1 Tax=marine sediment metagenome TaxID=412755 RepID=A0A0F9G241_9ZZZZ
METGMNKQNPLTESEKRMLRGIRRELIDGKRYDFWFVYEHCPYCDRCLNKAIGWEGGYELQLTERFRNDYSVLKGKQLIKNW